MYNSGRLAPLGKIRSEGWRILPYQALCKQSIPLFITCTFIWTRVGAKFWGGYRGYSTFPSMIKQGDFIGKFFLAPRKKFHLLFALSLLLFASAKYEQKYGFHSLWPYRWWYSGICPLIKLATRHYVGHLSFSPFRWNQSSFPLDLGWCLW